VEATLFITITFPIFSPQTLPATFSFPDPARNSIHRELLDRTNLARSKLVVPKVSGSCPPSECGFDYDAKNHVIGGGVKDNRFYVFDPAGRAWNSKVIQGARPGTMTFHCLAYNPVDDVYVFIANNQTWAYRWKR